MDKRQVSIELQSARRDAIEFLKGLGSTYEVADVQKKTIELFNMQQVLVQKLTSGTK